MLNLHNDGNSLSGIGRLLHISVSSVQRVIIRLVGLISKPVIQEKGEEYEMDELCTFCGQKGDRVWLIYAINRKTKQVVDFMVGRRILENIRTIANSVLALNPTYYLYRQNEYVSLFDGEKQTQNIRSPYQSY